MILGYEFQEKLRGTPLAIRDFEQRFFGKPVGGHPLRFVSSGFELLKNLKGHPLRFVIFISDVYEKKLGGHPLRFVILVYIYIFLKKVRGTSLVISDFEIQILENP